MKTNSKKLHIFLLFWLIAFWIITAISPLFRDDWMMENILFFLGFFALIFTYRKFTFSNPSYILLTIFLTLHLIGAHYTYVEVPFGYWLQDILHLKRNHFDRLIHFGFGLLLYYPVHEILSRQCNLKNFWLLFLSLNVILSCSAFFELIEWLFATNAYPELGAAYLGTQGDIWDAQWDMLLAFCGGMVNIFILLMMSFFKKI